MTGIKLENTLKECIRELDTKMNKLPAEDPFLSKQKLPYDIQRLLLRERKDCYETIIKLMDQK